MADSTGNIKVSKGQITYPKQGQGDQTSVSSNSKKTPTEKLFEDNIGQADQLLKEQKNPDNRTGNLDFNLAENIIDKIDPNDNDAKFKTATANNWESLGLDIAGKLDDANERMHNIAEVKYDSSSKDAKIYDMSSDDKRIKGGPRFYVEVAGNKTGKDAVSQKIDKVYIGNGQYLNNADVKFNDGKISQFSSNGVTVNYTYDDKNKQVKVTTTQKDGNVESDVYELETTNNNKDYVPGLQVTGNSKFQGKLVSSTSYSPDDLKNVKEDSKDPDVSKLLNKDAKSKYSKLTLAEQNEVQNYIIQSQKLSGGKWDAAKAVNNMLNDGFDPKVLNLKKGASLTDMLNRSLKYLNETYDKDLTYYDSSKGRITLDSNDSGDIVNYDSKNGRTIV